MCFGKKTLPRNWAVPPLLSEPALLIHAPFAQVLFGVSNLEISESTIRFAGGDTILNIYRT